VAVTPKPSSATGDFLYENGPTTTADGTKVGFTVDAETGAAQIWFSFNLLAAYFTVPRFSQQHYVVSATVNLAYNKKKTVTLNGVEVEHLEPMVTRKTYSVSYDPYEQKASELILLQIDEEDTTYASLGFDVEGLDYAADENAEVEVPQIDPRADETTNGLAPEILIIFVGGALVVFGCCIYMLVRLRRARQGSSNKTAITVLPKWFEDGPVVPTVGMTPVAAEKQAAYIDTS